MNNAAIWLTGVSGVGKTTTGKELQQLVSEQHELASGFSNCLLVDADVARKNLWPELGLNSEDRKKNVMRIARLGSIWGNQLENTLIVVACIAPVKEVRDEAIGIFQSAGNHVYLVHLDCPLEERIQRDPKGLYARAIRGEIQNLTGYDGNYDTPIDPSIKLNTLRWDARTVATRILGEITC